MPLQPRPHRRRGPRGRAGGPPGQPAGRDEEGQDGGNRIHDGDQHPPSGHYRRAGHHRRSRAHQRHDLDDPADRHGDQRERAEQGDVAVLPYADEVIRIPLADPFFEPLLAVVPLQIFAMELADAKGLDVDQPRNLAKSVTVE